MAGDVNGDGRTDLVVPASDETGSWSSWRPVTSTNRLIWMAIGSVGLSDVNSLCSEIAAGGSGFDPNGDGVTNSDDMTAMIERLGTVFGDSDLGGAFGSSDIVNVFIAGEYEDAVVGNSLYSTGDWNCDGDFTTSDLVFVFTIGSYDPDSNGAVAANLDAIADGSRSIDAAIAAAVKSDSRPGELPDSEASTNVAQTKSLGGSANATLEIQRQQAATAAIADFGTDRWDRFDDADEASTDSADIFEALTADLGDRLAKASVA